MTDFGAPENRRGNEARWSADHGIKPLEDEIERLTAENERLHFDYERLAERKPVEEAEFWRALADDLCDLVSRPAFAPEWFAERDRMVARCQEARQQQ